MDVGKSKFKSIIRQVQSSTGELLSNHSSPFNFKDKGSTSSSSGNTQLDLNSAIQYNHYLTNSYLQERDSRQKSLYEEIISKSEESEDSIIESISKEFFFGSEDVKQLTEQRTDVEQDADKLDECDPNNNQILELCVLAKLPQFSQEAPDLGDEFLHYLDKEKQRLTKQVTIVSKRLSDMILDNDEQFKSELNRVNSIQTELSNAIKICSNGRTSLSLTKRDFTSSGLKIVENYRHRETIISIIECLHNIKTIRNTMAHIENLLKYEKNFPSAIHLYHETFDILNSMAGKYLCVKEMKLKLVDLLLLAEEQMDAVLAKMPVRFCTQTYQQLCKAYKLIGKNENAIHQLLMHFTNTIYDKAFSIVLGYVELFTFATDTPSAALSAFTPVKGKKGAFESNCKQGSSNSSSSSNLDLKRKPFNELCQYLKPESFLPCLVDLCRALWDIMQNYYRILNFYQIEGVQSNTGLEEEEVNFAFNKLVQGIRTLWSDIQHKVRIMVSSVKFVESHLEGPGSNDSENHENEHNQVEDHQDQLLFKFEDFIKILTVCEKMIEIGEEFCLLYTNSQEETQKVDVTVELQNTLYKQTRAYFQSYHQVSMAELIIFLKNETWTRCPIESQNEFQLIANLQEFAFLKSKLLKLRRNETRANDLVSKKEESFGSKDSPRKSLSNSSSIILSPVAKPKQYFVTYFQQRHSTDDSEEEYSNITITPFDDILTSSEDNSATRLCFADSDTEDLEDYEEEGGSSSEIITTNTALTVLRLMGRYTHIMYLLQPISHDIIKALLELFDYYFFTVYRFFAYDVHSAPWLTGAVSGYQSSSGKVVTTTEAVNSPTTTQHQLINQVSAELRSFIRRINDTLIQSESSSSSLTPTTTCEHYVFNTPAIQEPTGLSSPPKRAIKYPCPVLPTYVPIHSPDRLFALCERILAIQSLIFISRQFYNLCPFLLDFLRNEHSDVRVQDQVPAGEKPEDGFKLLQFYHDQMCSSVESLLHQCLFAVSSRVLPYDSIISSMSQVKWDLKEIPSIHSAYIDSFVKEIQAFSQSYVKLLEEYDLQLLVPKQNENLPLTHSGSSELMETPLTKLDSMSRQINILLWESIIRVSNRSFVEGFSTAKKCTNEGRALMQLDYQQFLLHIEKLITFYMCGNGPTSATAVRASKFLLASEKDYVEEFVKAYYLTDSIFIDWIRQRHEYTTKQIVSLVNCIAGDNRKLKSSLLAAIDTTSLDNAIGLSTFNP